MDAIIMLATDQCLEEKMREQREMDAMATNAAKRYMRV
jgi:hypothetical protein